MGLFQKGEQCDRLAMLAGSGGAEPPQPAPPGHGPLTSCRAQDPIEITLKVTQVNDSCQFDRVCGNTSAEGRELEQFVLRWSFLSQCSKVSSRLIWL